jgi:ABC-type enterochelin transport system substrate-binding protein
LQTQDKRFLLSEIETLSRRQSSYRHAERVCPVTAKVRAARRIISAHEKRTRKLGGIFADQAAAAREKAIFAVRFGTDKQAVAAFKEFSRFKFRVPKNFR